MSRSTQKGDLLMPIRESVLAGLWLCLAIPGCSKVPPPVTEAGGVVKINGAPLANVQVEFVPDLADFGAETNSSAVTDENGHFQLIYSKTGQPGAVIASHRVLVMEGPVPSELRGMSATAQDGLANYLKRLKNRPIPEQYGSVGKTPLRVEVKADKKEYEIDLTR
jgi:hypothetical protein